MNKIKKVKIGFVSLIQLNFRGDKQKQYNKSVEDLTKLSQKFMFDLFVYPQMVVTPEDAENVSKKVKDEKVDLVLIQNTSFASGFLIQSIAYSAPFIGLWAVQEETQSGYLPQNSFCGMNLNGSIIKEYLNDEIKYKWFFGNCDDELMVKRLEITIKALFVIKNMKNSKIGHIGGTAPGFTDFYFDERKLAKKLGVSVIDFEYGDIKQLALSYSDDEIKMLADEMRQEAKCVSQLAKDKLKQNAMVYKAIVDIMENNNISGAAMSCWPRFRVDWSFTPCAVFGRLNQNGYIISCEGDVLSAVSMMMLKYAANYEPILMDLVSFDRADDTLQLWHCGVASKNYAKDGQVLLDTHYNPGPYDKDRGWLDAGPVATMKFEQNPFTCMRLTKDCEEILLFRGDIIDKDPVYHGSAGWISNITTQGKPFKSLDLVNTVMINGFQHHYPLVKGNVEDIIIEIAAWLGINVMKQVEYKNYLQLN